MKLLDNLEEWLIAFLMGAATLIIFVAVVHRYALGIPFLFPFLFRFDTSWAQELCIFLFIWMAKFGAAYGVRTGIHVGVDVLVNRLQPAWRRRVILLGLTGGFGFTATIGLLATHMVWKIAQTDQTSPDLEAPMWLVYLCLPLGSFLMSFRFLQVGRHFLRHDELPRHDHSAVEGMEIDDLEQEGEVIHPEEAISVSGGGRGKP
ncbi:MAG: TRAP transporter small permease [Magnetococcales bacterium]|nr:TRAP transporter small permease [Magnetococcales bacterium]